MTNFRSGTRLLVAAATLILTLSPAFAQAETDALSRKDAPAGRQRLTPRGRARGARAGGCARL
jgi:hypothetical protein